MENKNIKQCDKNYLRASEASAKAEDFERYGRNILLSQIDKAGQEKLLNSKILIAGAGGLGSTVIANLAGIGIGLIGIIDNDTIELSNLNRQYIHKFKNIGKLKTQSAEKWIKNFNPEINVKTYPIKLNRTNYKDIISEYDVIIDCFDSFNSKFLLNEAAVKLNKILIHGGVSEFYGQVTVIKPKKTACLKCFLEEKDKIIAKGVLSPVVSIIASIQALETVKVLLGIGQTLENKLLCFDGLNMSFKIINLIKNINCKNC